MRDWVCFMESRKLNESVKDIGQLLVGWPGIREGLGEVISSSFFL